MEGNDENPILDREGQRLKVCLNCRHLIVLEMAEEVPGLGDTAFMRTKCGAFDVEFIDHYAFPEADKTVRITEKPVECNHWESWDSDQGSGLENG